ASPPAQLPARRPVTRSAPLGLAQQRLWIFEQLMPGTACYNESSAQYLEGAPDRRAARRAIAEIVRRHEILRTTYRTVNGEPVQVIGEPFEPPLPFHDLRHLAPDARAAEIDRLVRGDAAEPFDLARGPMLRARLVQTED